MFFVSQKRKPRARYELAMPNRAFVVPQGKLNMMFWKKKKLATMVLLAIFLAVGMAVPICSIAAEPDQAKSRKVQMAR